MKGDALNMKKIKVGLVGLIHPCMQGDDAGIHNSVLNAMKELQNQLNFELVVINRPFNSEEDGKVAREFLEKESVDLTLVFNSSLGLGRAILQLCKVNSFLGIWSLPEPVQTGVLQLNSFCGLNMNSAIAESYFREYNIQFKWFYGYPQSELFLERFKITLSAVKAIKTLRNSRIGLIGDVALGFENMIFDERELEKRFGTYIYTRHSVEDIVEIAKKYDSKKVDSLIDKFSKEGEWLTKNVSKEEMERVARVILALEDFAKENNYNTLAINCWTKFQEYYDIAICGAVSRLNESGIVVACEGDVPGALMMTMLNAITDSASTLMDMVSLDEDDTSACLWHCGPTASSWADKDGVKWNGHCIFGCQNEGQWCGKGVVANMNFKPGEVTVARVNSSFDKLFVMNAQIMENKKGFEGSSGWINNMEMEGYRLSIQDLINTIVTNRIDHHYPVVYGNVSDVLYEVANWLKMDVAQPISYKPYMQDSSNLRNKK